MHLPEQTIAGKTTTLKGLHELYDWTEGIHKKVLFQVLRKYGPDKLQL